MSTYQELLEKSKTQPKSKYEVHKIVRHTEVGWDEQEREAQLRTFANDMQETPFAPISCTFIDCTKPVYPYKSWADLEVQASYLHSMCTKHYNHWVKQNA